MGRNLFLNVTLTLVAQPSSHLHHGRKQISLHNSYHFMAPHAEHDTNTHTNGDMSNHEAALTNGETPSSRVLSVSVAHRAYVLATKLRYFAFIIPPPQSLVDVDEGFKTRFPSIPMQGCDSPQSTSHQLRCIPNTRCRDCGTRTRPITPTPGQGIPNQPANARLNSTSNPTP